MKHIRTLIIFAILALALVQGRSAVVSATGDAAAAPPVLTSMTPDKQPIGSGGFTLTITGSGFAAGDTVYFNGEPRSTSVSNATKLTAQITGSDILSLGQKTVTVQNKDFQFSNHLYFSVTEAKPPVLSAMSPSSRAAGSGSFTLTITGSGFAEGDTVYFNGEPRTTKVDSSTKLTAQIVGDDILTLGQKTVTVQNKSFQFSNHLYFSVTQPKQSQTITFNALADRPVGSPPFTVSATASSGLAVTFSAAGQCSVNGTTVTLSGQAGSCTITAHQSGNDQYNAAPSVSRSFAITAPNKQNQTISFAPLPNRTVGDAPFQAVATASSGLAVAFSAAGQCSVNGAMVTLNGQVGSCTITAKQAGNATYNAADVTQSFQILPKGASALYSAYLPMITR